MAVQKTSNRGSRVNQAVFMAAIRAGCTRRQAETIAWYVEMQKLSAAAAQMGITESTAQDHLAAVYHRLHVHHAAAAVARLLN